MLTLNLGCGTKTSNLCVNIDWGVYVRLQNNRVLQLLAKPFLSADRRNRLENLSKNVMVHDMRKGLPFADDSVDAVYHSHMLEHIDQEHVSTFQAELRRVLKRGGIQRICVPDLEYVARRYVANLDQCESDLAARQGHDAYVADLLEQSVRKEAASTSEQPRARRVAENILLGDARKRGETHQWMYDRFNLTEVLQEAGFSEVHKRAWNESAIPGWEKMALEVDEEGAEYKPNSLYIEAVK